MTSGRTSDRFFFTVSALLFAACGAATIFWSRSMSTMDPIATVMQSDLFPVFIQAIRASTESAKLRAQLLPASCFIAAVDHLSQKPVNLGSSHANN
jgi:hypothetical protein